MKIERTMMKQLVCWKNAKDRAPLILKGVRQCGKTWLLQEFGKNNFENTVYLNFEQDERLGSFFQGAYIPGQILSALETYVHQPIKPQSTLLIFDEIQTCPRALNSLKYFCEQAPGYAIACAGSLLGVSLASPEGFPVGKVNFLELFPCTFQEYLHAVDPALEKYCDGLALEPIPDAFATRLEIFLREYMAFGGMPKVMAKFIETHDSFAADRLLDEVVQSYESDFSKHVPAKDTPRLFLLWRSVPEQIARENRRFIYGEVRQGARAKELEDSLQWLVCASMVRQVYLTQNPELPLSAYENRKIFKLYVADVGLLRKLTKLDCSVILDNLDVFGTFKGKFVENFVLQQFVALGIDPICYWTNPDGMAEIDFIIQDKDIVIPVEVKSGLNLLAKSLRTYREKYSPQWSIRLSLQNVKEEQGLLNLPLYLIGEMPRLLAAARSK